MTKNNTTKNNTYLNINSKNIHNYNDQIIGIIYPDGEIEYSLLNSDFWDDFKRLQKIHNNKLSLKGFSKNNA